MRIGNRGIEALCIINRNPAQPKFFTAIKICPYQKHATVHFGYKVINRLVRKGLVEAKRVHSSRYEVSITEKGKAALAERVS